MEKKLINRRVMQRVASALLTLVLLFGMVPASVFEAKSASWMEEYLEKVVDWGVMRGDVNGNLNEDGMITRAEFVTMINRAFGYTGSTSHPFEDVKLKDWYNNDIGIAYNMGYFKGTGETTASPNAYLTREQAVVLIGRNLLLQEKKGETLGFSDSRTFSSWSRGMIESAINAGYVSGYSDGSFLPQKNVSRGEVAAMLVKAIGTMVNDPGTHILGGVYGNVMISSSGVTLKNTTIAGNLYITGGLELGDVLLDNVVVLGKIIISGAGRSNKGDSSVILRNVESGELVIDSIANQYVSVRAEGDTQIGFTDVKTGAYLEDRTAAGDGFLYVEINGEAGMDVTMAGNIEEVLNRTPASFLTIAQGTAKFVTIDENAIGAQLEIKNIASIEELNLDVGVPVIGEGDISEINVSAPGAVVDILPDDINIRPGLQATIAGEEMDTKEGDESSEDPRILSTYPKVKNIAPTSAEVVFQTNKKGTIYWALTSVIDGPVTAEDLLEVKDYNTKILQQGTINATSSAKDFMVKVSKLTADGSYYVTAMLVDSRGQQSAVKHVLFSTPDATAPKFATGYPELTLVKMDYAQVSVMSTKSSVLYYALLPKGAGAPTINEFKAGAISGDLGNCPTTGIPVTKNMISILNICKEGKLEEQKTYELYMCLIDPDNGKDSGVKRITFTTIDGTPPELMDAVVTGIQKNGLSLTTSMNEAGTIYWVAVRAGLNYVGDLDERALILQVVNGIGNIVKAGKATATANKDVVLKISGLEAETTYDIYYVAMDKAGNYSGVKMISANTLDDEAPEVRQEFTKTVDAQGKEPLAETDVKIIFDEGVRNKDSQLSFYEQYKIIKDKNSTPLEVAEAKKALVRDLEKSVQLWDISNVSASYQVKHDATADDERDGTWINYEKVELEMTPEGELVITFKHGVAISLSSGSTYQFYIEDITDVSNSKNAMRPNPYKIPAFTTVFAQVNLTSRVSGNANVEGLPMQWSGYTVTNQSADIDMRFWLDPQSTESVNSNVYYDIWIETSDLIIYFDVYCRVVDTMAGVAVTDAAADDGMSMFADCTRVDENGWCYLGNMSIYSSGGTARSSVNGLINGDNTTKIPQLNTLNDDYTYEFIIDVTEINGSDDEESWSEDVKMKVMVPAGQDLSGTDYAKNNPWTNDVTNIGNPADFEISRKFIDTKTPRFMSGNPTFNAGDGMVEMNVMLDRAGTLYYVIAPMYTKEGGYEASILTRGYDAYGNEVDFKELFELGVCPPINGDGITEDNPMGFCPTLAAPTKDSVALMVDKGASSVRIKTGKKSVGTNLQTIKVDGLDPLTTYFVYCILTGESQKYSEVYCFQFTTEAVSTPTIELKVTGGDIITAQTSTPAEMSWAVYSYDMAYKIFNDKFKSCVPDDKKNAYAADCARLALNADTLTVIQALLISMSSEDDRSLFDVYADEQTKKNVLEYVQGEATSSYSPAETGDKTFPTANRAQTIKPTQLSPETTYYFIAAARNQLGQSYGFKAVGGVHLADSEAPTLLDYDTYVHKFASEIPGPDGKYVYNVPLDWALQTSPRTYAYKGTVTLQFSEKIYQLLRMEDLSTMLENITSGNFSDKVKISGGDLAIKNVDVSGGTITFDFEHVTVGATITIFKEGSISDAYSNVNGQGARLVLKFVVDTTEGFLESFTEPRFEISWVSGD